MSLAVLVLGYRASKILRRVLPVYFSAGFDVYAHIDEKISVDEYMSELRDIDSKVHYIESRQSIFWAGFSMSVATISLIEAAMAKKDYSNFLLVSDDTAPIAPLDLLKSRLISPVERISLREIKENDPFFTRYQRFFHFDHSATSLLGRPIEESHMDDKFFNNLSRLIARKNKGKANIKLFYGSQWWCLTEKSAKMILDMHKNREDIRESFEFSAVPDEMYFQTLVGNFSDLTHIANSQVFVEWSKQPKPFVYSNMSDLPIIDSDHHLFIRKISANSTDFAEELLQTRVLAPSGS